jgi:hypothetical protein
MDKDKQLSEVLKQILENATVVHSTIDDNGNIFIPKSLLEEEPKPLSKVEERFFFTLVGIAQWAVAHPSTSQYVYLSPEEIKAIPNLKNAFMVWWYNEHPGMKPEQEKMFNQSIKDGLFPSAVIEHTSDGHNPIGWSWGSEFYLADFYLCLTYAMIQLGARLGKDVSSEFAPLIIAKQVQAANRVKPTVEIVEAMGKLMEEPDPNKTAEYSVIEGGSN